MQAKAQLQRSWIKLLELQKLQLLVQSVLWNTDKPEPGVALLGKAGVRRGSWKAISLRARIHSAGIEDRRVSGFQCFMQDRKYWGLLAWRFCGKTGLKMQQAHPQRRA